MKKLLPFLLMSIVSLLIIGGCTTPQAARCIDPEDTPVHHYLRGMEALENGKIELAKEKFDRADFCDEEFSVAHGGLAIVAAERAKANPDPTFRNVESERAFKELAKAKKLSKSDEERFDYYLAVLRVHLILKDSDWLEKAEDAHKDALALKTDDRKMIFYQGKEAAHYYLGLAYLDLLEFQKARDRFADVLSARSEGKWHEKADRAWKKTDRIVRALAGITFGDVGKKIAVKDTITRGDLSALLIDELKLDKLFAGRIPAASKVAEIKVEFTPADILASHFKEEILVVLKWKVRGLEPKYNETTRAYLFMPADGVTRGEMAFILEDILIRIAGDPKLATAFIGQDTSPFPDVRSTSPLYNAVMNMTTRGIMEGELSGEFRVNAPVTGAEALLAMRQLKQRMNTY